MSTTIKPRMKHRTVGPRKGCGVKVPWRDCMNVLGVHWTQPQRDAVHMAVSGLSDSECIKIFQTHSDPGAIIRAGHVAR